MKKNKVIFLDRDGTINYDFGYVYQKEKLKFIEGTIEGLQKLMTYGYKFIIITNQSGIGRGYFTLEQYNDFTNYMLEELRKSGVKILDIFYCPHISKDNCSCRKPKLKLFYDAIKKHNVDIENSYAIGDKIRDLAICEETNIKGILLGEQSDKYISKHNLLDAANYIINEENEEKI